MPYQEYQDFKAMQTNSGNGNKLSKYITSANITRALVMRGLPFKVTVEEIQSFFKGYGELMKSDIVIEEIGSGKRTGTALVFFEDET